MRQVRCYSFTFLIGLFLGMGYGQGAHEDLFVKRAREFLATPEGGGKENALYYYANALDGFDSRIYYDHRGAFEKILKEGWKKEYTTETEVLKSVEPALEEIRHGNARTVIRYSQVRTIRDPFADPMELFGLQRFILLKAREVEFRGDTAQAWSWYRDALIFGQRMSDAHVALIQELISLGSESRALKEIERFLERTKLSAGELRKIAEWLAEQEKGQAPLWSVLENDMNVNWHLLEDNPTSKPAAREIALVWRKEAQGDFERVREWVGAELKDGYRKDFAAAATARIGEVPVMNRALVAMVIPPEHYAEIVRREYETIARWRLVESLAEVLAYRAEKGKLPSRAEDVEALGFTWAKDPFEGKPLRYRLETGGAVIYSVGPDVEDNGGRVEYKMPEKGIGTGDIIVRVSE